MTTPPDHLPFNNQQAEAEEAAAKCGATLSSLEGDAAEVDALKKGLDRRHRQAEKEAAELAVREQELTRCSSCLLSSCHFHFDLMHCCI